jgi:hypothetical protein
MQLQPLNLWVCHPCLDRPQIQLRTIILPPDPVPVYLPFPEPYASEVPSYMSTQTGNHLTTLSGVKLTMTIQVTPTPNQNNTYLAPDTFPVPQG